MILVVVRLFYFFIIFLSSSSAINFSVFLAFRWLLFLALVLYFVSFVFVGSCCCSGSWLVLGPCGVFMGGGGGGSLCVCVWGGSPVLHHCRCCGWVLHQITQLPWLFPVMSSSLYSLDQCYLSHCPCPVQVDCPIWDPSLWAKMGVVGLWLFMFANFPFPAVFPLHKSHN